MLRMHRGAPTLDQINVIVRDMEASVAFYRRLGLEIDAAPGSQHVTVRLPNGLDLEFDSVDFASQWDSACRGATGGGVVIGFSLPSREAVDEAYDDLTGAGGTGHQPPYDAFWGARYAIVEDPDGNAVGLMSPIDASSKFWPPVPPPRSST
jgi:catechol 2,3-dioxygenase-like lactoylglutathione lyase family enzyme